MNKCHQIYERNPKLQPTSLGGKFVTLRGKIASLFDIQGTTTWSPTKAFSLHNYDLN